MPERRTERKAGGPAAEGPWLPMVCEEGTRRKEEAGSKERNGGEKQRPSGLKT